MGKKKKGGNQEEGGSSQEPPKPQQQHPAPQQQQTSQSDEMKRQGGAQGSQGSKRPANTWKCTNCPFDRNFETLDNCYKCGTPRQGASGSGNQPKPKCKEPRSSGGQQQRQNPGPSQQQRQNPGPSQQWRQDPAPSQQAQPKRPPSDENQPRKERKLGPGDWMCPKCDNHNFAKKNKCNRCQEPKPVALQPQATLEVPRERPHSSQQQPMGQRSESVASVASGVSQMSLGSGSTSPPKKSKHSSPFIIESSPTPTEYEGKKGEKCILEVNYGKISFNKNFPKVAYHYDVTFTPDVPKKFLPYALDEFFRQHFPQFIFASDNRKNVYTAQPLRTVDGNEVDGFDFARDVNAKMGDRSKDFNVKIKLAGTKEMSTLLNWDNPVYEKNDKPSEAIQALDVVLRKPFRNINGTIQVQRGLYFAPRPNQRMSLGDGMELWYGLFQSAIMGRGGLYLNVDVLHKAFPSQMPLLQYIRDNLVFSRDQNAPRQIPRSLEPRQIYTLKDHLKMLSIIYRFNNEVKSYGFNDLIEPRNATFTNEQGQLMHVKDYYQRVKGVTLRYPDMPYLWVGSRNKKVYLPLEFCEIPAGQATNKKCSPKATAAIIKYSATSTEERKQKIKSLLAQINYETDPTITGFGINVSKEFQKIEGRVIDAPNLVYARGKTVQPQRGAWNGGNFIQPEQGQIKWCIINCDNRTTPTNLMTFARNFCEAAKRQNVNLMPIRQDQIFDINGNDRNFKENIKKELDLCLQENYRLVVVIVIDQNECYGRVKQAAELNVGILTQCIKANTIFRMGKGNPMMTINNILLKVNAKLNGKNHEIDEESYKKWNQKTSGVMFVGADVTHPSPDQRNIPSVVGVASSYDDVGFKYCCDWYMQDPKKEMIVDLAQILTKHLQFYQSKNKCLPGKIFYYRDGVSDGQFKEVLAIEMKAIQDAIKAVYGMKYEHAKVTFIVVQKRHHTRFFPTHPDFTDGKFKNILPGTVVDKNIIHPFQYQFFMASHAAIQGVTKPTKYCILVNESKISPDDIQAITYDLCHLFTRCNRSVSYPAPTYYAHLVAARGKNYFAGDRVNVNNLQQENRIRNIKPAIRNDAPMFFV